MTVAVLALAVALGCGKRTSTSGPAPAENAAHEGLQHVELSGLQVAAYPGSTRVADSQSQAAAQRPGRPWIVLASPDPLEKVGRFYVREYGGRGASISGDSKFILIRRPVTDKTIEIVLNRAGEQTEIEIAVLPGVQH